MITRRASNDTTMKLSPPVDASTSQRYESGVIRMHQDDQRYSTAGSLPAKENTKTKLQRTEMIARVYEYCI